MYGEEGDKANVFVVVFKTVVNVELWFKHSDCIYFQAHMVHVIKSWWFMKCVFLEVFFHQNVLYTIYQPVWYLIGMLKRRKGRENKFEYLIYSVDEGRTGRALRRVKKTNWKRVNYCKTGSTLTGFCPKKKLKAGKVKENSLVVRKRNPMNLLFVYYHQTLWPSHKHGLSLSLSRTRTRTRTPLTLSIGHTHTSDLPTHTHTYTSKVWSNCKHWCKRILHRDFFRSCSIFWWLKFFPFEKKEMFS